MYTDYAQGDVGAVIRISWDVNFQGTPRLGKRLTPPPGGGGDGDAHLGVQIAGFGLTLGVWDGN